METIKKNRSVRGIYQMVRRYNRHYVGIESAALAFYLLFTIFPLLIFISALLGMLQLDVVAVLRTVGEVLPREIVDFLELYLVHVEENSSVNLLLFGLFFSIYFPMRAANTLMRAVRTAYHLGPPKNALIHWLKTLAYTVFLMAGVALSLILLTVSDRMLNYGVERFHLPIWVAEIWAQLRFPIIAAVGYFALFFLYAMAQDQRQPWRNIWPGTLMSLVGWMATSLLYSWYVEHIAHYSVLYGSLGTVIVLMIWLNLTSMVLIMGAEFNATLMSLRKDTEKRKEIGE